MKRIQFIMTGLLIALVISACGKKAEEKAQQIQPQGTVQTAQQPSQATIDTMATQPATTPPTESKPVADKPAAKPAKREAKIPQEKVIKASSDTKETMPKAVVVTIPSETQIKVKLIDSIDTDVHVTGAKFRGVLAEPLRVNDRMVFEQGTAVMGVLDTVVESGRLKTPAQVSFSLVSIIDQNGTEIPVTTSMISEKKGSHTNRDAELIGGGALAGAIIGKLTGKKGGTAIGAAAGAAAGTGAAAATGKKDIVYHAGTEVIFNLKAPVDVTVQQGTVAKGQ
jgi:hypothetical protein